MTVKTAPLSIAKVLKHLEQGHKDTIQQANEFQDLLTKLRYEGRASYGKNLKEIRHTFDFFHGEILYHMQVEEEVLFPFLTTHIPKLESVIHLLQAEHEDFKEQLESFDITLKLLTRESSDADRSLLIEKIRHLGTYLLHFLCSHAHAEDKSLYQVLQRELKVQEKRELAEKMLCRMKQDF